MTISCNLFFSLFKYSLLHIKRRYLDVQLYEEKEDFILLDCLRLTLHVIPFTIHQMVYKFILSYIKFKLG